MTDLPTCPPWCTDHKTGNYGDSCKSDPWVLSREGHAGRMVGIYLSACDHENGDAGDPGIGLWAWPDSPSTIPLGLTIDEARALAEKLAEMVAAADACMSETCTTCSAATVPSSEQICDRCRMDAWLERRPRAVRSMAHE